MWGRLRTQLRVGGVAALAPMLRGLVMRAILGVESVAERAAWTRRRVERLNGRRLKRAWWFEQRRRKQEAEPLRTYEHREFSQNGEDGILERIFALIGTTNRSLVEIGASDGQENCTRKLVEAGWTGVWIEADPERARQARSVAAGRVVVIDEPAEPVSIAGSLRSAGIPERPDLLVMDIDGNDWWVLGAVLAAVSPRVLVTEYNSTYRPGRWWVQPYREGREWDGTFRHGASLEALSALARLHGLALVGCDSRGVNAFFVAASEVDRVETGRSRSVAAHFMAPWFAPGLWGHPRTPERPQPLTERLSEQEQQAVSLSAAPLGRRSMVFRPGQPVVVDVSVTNLTTKELSSLGSTPLQIALRWRPHGTPYGAWGAEQRVRLRHPVGSGRRRRMTIWQPAPVGVGTHHLDLVLVQENVAWLDRVPTSVEVEVGDAL